MAFQSVERLIPQLEIGDMVEFRRMASMSHYGVWLGDDTIIHVTIPHTEAASGSCYDLLMKGSNRFIAHSFAFLLPYAMQCWLLSV